MNILLKIFKFVKKNPLDVLCGGSLVLVVVITLRIGNIPEGTLRVIAGYLLVVVLPLCFLISAIMLVIKYKRKKPEQILPLTPNKPRIDSRNGIWNRSCDVIHSYRTVDYSKEAEFLAVREDTKFIFTFCVFNPTKIVKQLAKYIHYGEMLGGKKAYNEEDYKNTLDRIRKSTDQEFSRETNGVFGHFQAFRDKAISINIKPTEIGKKCWVIRVLFIEEDYESKYENRKENNGICYSDFLKFRSIDYPIPCFVITERILRDKSIGLDTEEASDFTVFFHSSKTGILSWSQIVNKQGSGKELILDYYAESNTIIASSDIPTDYRGRLFYCRILEEFRSRYQHSNIFIPLPIYMSTHFPYNMTEEDKKIFSLLDISL